MFSNVSAICMSLLEKSQILCSSFKLGYLIFFFFFLLSCICSFCTLTINPLLPMWFANIFSHSVGCLFILLMVSFAVTALISYSLNLLLSPHIRANLGRWQETLGCCSFCFLLPQHLLQTLRYWIVWRRQKK